MPPFNAVRAFKPAARAGGFQAAGAELNVSANAVGRLVKVLEDWLGVALFKRLSRGVVLTEVERRYLAGPGVCRDDGYYAATRRLSLHFLEPHAVAVRQPCGDEAGGEAGFALRHPLLRAAQGLPP